MEVAAFAALEAVFFERAGRAVYCVMATIDERNRPRTGILYG